MNKENTKKMLLILSIAGIGVWFAISILGEVASYDPDFKSEKPIDTNMSVVAELNYNKSIIEEKEAEEEMSSRVWTIEEVYAERPRKAFLDDNRTLYISLDNNHKACYIHGKSLIAKNGLEIPYNYVPRGARCSDIEIVKKDGVPILKTSTLSSIYNSDYVPEGYKLWIKGEGLDVVVQNCVGYWADRCDAPPSSTVIISEGSPETLPAPNSTDALVLTRKLPDSFISGSKSYYSFNDSFYQWKKVPFESAYAINGLSDGVYVSSAEEAYEGGENVVINTRDKVIMMKIIDDYGNPCYIDDKGFPVNRFGQTMQNELIPPFLSCKEMNELKGVTVINSLDSAVLWKKAENGYKLRWKERGGVILEKCGKYWADECVDLKKQKVAVSLNGREELPKPENPDRLSLSKNKGKRLTNTAEGIRVAEYDNYYLWHTAAVKNNVNGMADLIMCGQEKGCYEDRVAKSAEYAVTPDGKVIHYIVNSQKVNLWVSAFDKNKILAVGSNDWSTVKDIEDIKGITEDQRFFWYFDKKMSFDEGNKECMKIGMRLPDVEETTVSTENGIYTNDWAWIAKRLDQNEASTWRGAALSRQSQHESAKVICVIDR